VVRKSALGDDLTLAGRYEIECVGPNGEIKWRDVIDNLVTTAGKNLLLDTVLAGEDYTVVGPFIGLISGGGLWRGTRSRRLHGVACRLDRGRRCQRPDL
jgi:hypothetical protein